MNLDPDLLDKLACPQCRGNLAVAAGGVALTCAACRLSYPVNDGIPGLMASLAQPLPAVGGAQ